MPLILKRREFGENQFSVFDRERYIGRLYKTSRQDWYWGLEPGAAGDAPINGHAATPAEAMAKLTAAWENAARG